MARVRSTIKVGVRIRARIMHIVRISIRVRAKVKNGARYQKSLRLAKSKLAFSRQLANNHNAKQLK